MLEIVLDFNNAMTELIRELVRVIPDLSAIRTEQIQVSTTTNHSNRHAGVLAYVLPLRYRHGSPVEMRVRGNRAYHYAMLPVNDLCGNEILYIIYFMLPRFYHLSLRDKLETVIHELYHISPRFDGDLRRFKGRSELHGSLKSYDIKIKQLTEAYLALSPNPMCYQFLKGGFRQTERAYGGIKMRHIPEPKPRLIKVASLS